MMNLSLPIVGTAAVLSETGAAIEIVWFTLCSYILIGVFTEFHINVFDLGSLLVHGRIRLQAVEK
jgi:hypothetical protein